MTRIFVCLMLVGILLIYFSGCNNLTSNQLSNSTTEVITEPNMMTETETESSPSMEMETEIEPNLALDFQYETNSNQTGIVINKYIGKKQDVVIPSYIENLPVVSLKGIPDEYYTTAISEGVFQGSNIKTVVIPKTVRSIGYAAFRDCKELTTITLLSDSSLTNISGKAFANCVKLEKIDLSSTQVKIIDPLAFQGCTNLKEIAFSETLEEIRAKAFYECFSLLEINFPNSLTKIEGGAFAYCTNLQHVSIPKSMKLTSFDEAIFHNVGALKQIIFEEGRESIIGYALFQTDANVEIIVPKGVKKFSPLTFLINPTATISITFLGDAPEIVEDDTDWFGNPTIYYDPEATGWDTFSWKEKFEMKPISAK